MLASSHAYKLRTVKKKVVIKHYGTNLIDFLCKRDFFLLIIVQKPKSKYVVKLLLLLLFFYSVTSHGGVKYFWILPELNVINGGTIIINHPHYIL